MERKDKNGRVYLIITTVLIVISLALLPALIKTISLSIGMNHASKIKLPPEQIKAGEEALKKDIARYDKLLANKIPKSYFLIINTSANEFYLYKGKTLVKQDKCSTGSYILLKNGENEEWLFKTPKGEFRVQTKTAYPVWKKPDWAFIEEGLPVPPKNHHTRFEYGVLGDYALGFGQGYLIHGTLYQRFLGLPVTHGCVRLNDENLELVYNSLSIGSKIFIY